MDPTKLLMESYIYRLEFLSLASTLHFEIFASNTYSLITCLPVLLHIRYFVSPSFHVPS
jgi:hypothetical protein